MRHTPGPWKVRRHIVFAEPGLTGAEIAAVRVRDNWEDNARFIAAAPELYNAVRDAERVLGDLLHAGEVSDAAPICTDRLTALLKRLEDV